MKKSLNLGIFTAIALVLGFIFLMNSVAFAANSPQSQASIARLTANLLNANYAYTLVSPEKKPEALRGLVTLAENRRAALVESLEKNPRLILENALSEELAARFPGEVKSLLEGRLATEGTMAVFYLDNFATRESDIQYLLTDKEGVRRNVYFVDGEPEITSGSRVQINGIALGDNLVASVSSGNVEVISSDTQTFAATELAQKKLLITLFNFQNDTREPYTIDHVRGNVFTNQNSANGYYRENSFGQLEFVGKLQTDGDIFGWYTIPYNRPTNSAGCGYSNFTSWGTAADQKAIEAGVDISGYDMKMYVFPNQSCGWSGMGSIGGNPGLTFINGSFDSVTPAVYVLSHELGHNLGREHADGFNCTDGSGTRQSITANCTTAGYADPFDVMGGNSSTRHMNNYHKGQTGTNIPNWLMPENTLTVTADGTYLIEPIEQSSTGVQVLRIPKTYSYNGGAAVSGYYYLEFRQPFGYDNFISTSRVVNGVTLRLAPDYSFLRKTHLIDATPSTASFHDSALIVGQTFEDVAMELTIRTESVSPSGALVRVDFGPIVCSPQSPTVTLTPANQSAYAGQTLSYTVALTDNNSSACGTTSYTVTPTLPSGWSQTPTSLSISLSPGGSASNVVNVTSATNATAGAHSLTETVTNTSNALTASAPATFMVLADITAPVVTITKPANGSTVPNKGKLSIAASAVDAGGVTEMKIFFDNTLIKTCLASSCSASISVMSISKGTHTILVSAKDPTGNTGSATVAVTKN